MSWYGRAEPRISERWHRRSRRGWARRRLLSAPPLDPGPVGRRAVLVVSAVRLALRACGAAAGWVWGAVGVAWRCGCSRRRRQPVTAGRASGGSGGSSPRARTASHGEGAQRAPKLKRRRVATGANHPASQSSAFRRGPGTPAGAPTGDQSTGLNSTPNPAPMHQSTNTSASRICRTMVPEHNRNIAADLPEHRLSARCASLLLVASASVTVRLTWAWGSVREGPAGRGVTLRQVRFVSAETPGAVGLTSAVGEHNSEVWNHERADRRNGGKPACARCEQRHRQDETAHAEGHHDQVPALPVGNVIRARRSCLGHQVRGAAAAVARDPHVSKLLPVSGPVTSGISATDRAPASAIT